MVVAPEGAFSLTWWSSPAAKYQDSRGYGDQHEIVDGGVQDLTLGLCRMGSYSFVDSFSYFMFLLGLLLEL